MLRYVGYSAGSALSATLLVTTIPVGASTPTESGYDAAAWIGIVALATATVLSRRAGRGATARRH
ncbi:hypothetical protein AB0L40_18985 [Patulibacter sp. NPDC049589]|uniref:hypothetical protein n=1 Tax=Patulibacter sp. NPDC049589 TaxID=3154731 RepID=UPI003442E78E